MVYHEYCINWIAILQVVLLSCFYIWKQSEVVKEISVCVYVEVSLSNTSQPARNNQEQMTIYRKSSLSCNIISSTSLIHLPYSVIVSLIYSTRERCCGTSMII